MTPTTVFVNLLRDTEGNSRGFEKSRDNKFYMDEPTARFHNFGNQQYNTEECILMSKDEYEAIQTLLTAAEELASAVKGLYGV